MDTLPIYVVIGSEPDAETKPLEIFMEPERAAQYVMDGLMTSMMMLRGGVLEPGDQVSMIVTIGDPKVEPESMTSGSVAVIGSHGRRAWDFRVEKRWAPR